MHYSAAVKGHYLPGERRKKTRDRWDEAGKRGRNTEKIN
jgi:hypothetical protein